jgi:hypothetical protein
MNDIKPVEKLTSVDKLPDRKEKFIRSKHTNKIKKTNE